jgi:hypothetical protein
MRTYDPKAMILVPLAMVGLLAISCRTIIDELTITADGKAYRPRVLYKTQESIYRLTLRGDRILWGESFEDNRGSFDYRLRVLDRKQGKRPEVLIGKDVPFDFAADSDGTIYELVCEGKGSSWEKPARYWKRDVNQAPQDVTNLIWPNSEVRCVGGIYIDSEDYLYALTEKGLQKTLPDAIPTRLVPMEEILSTSPRPRHIGVVDVARDGAVYYEEGFFLAINRYDRIFRVSPDGTMEDIFEVDFGYVFDAALASSGDLFLSGAEIRTPYSYRVVSYPVVSNGLFRITAQGEIEPLVDSPDRWTIGELAFDDDGNLIALVSPNLSNCPIGCFRDTHKWILEYKLAEE